MASGPKNAAVLDVDMGDISDESEGQGSDAGDGEDEELTAEEIAALEEMVAADPTLYDIHLALLRAHAAAFDIEALTAARERFATAFPLTPDLWLAWIKVQPALCLPVLAWWCLVCLNSKRRGRDERNQLKGVNAVCLVLLRLSARRSLWLVLVFFSSSAQFRFMCCCLALGRGRHAWFGSGGQ